jgi:hypothetical protein
MEKTISDALGQYEVVVMKRHQGKASVGLDGANKVPGQAICNW